MNVKCEYCGNEFSNILDKCPTCGSPNKEVFRTVEGQPKTIEELLAWYKSKGLPPFEVTRFFIGVDYRQPKAFGIYKDSHSGNCVVYMNNPAGERLVRYSGTDEVYAVNELYNKLKNEILKQKAKKIN